MTSHFACGRDGAGFELGASLIGAIPLVGDAGKAVLRGGRKIATEATSETAERAGKEVAERAAGEAAGLAARGMEQMRQGFRALLGEARYAESAREVEKVKAMRPELKDIPTEDLVAIRGYTSQDYEVLNPALRNNDVSQLKRLEPYIKCAESGLSQLPSHVGTVFRGTNLTADQAAKYAEVGKVVTEPHFFSTSEVMGRAFPGNTKYVINSVQGKDVSYLSEIAGEKEILFRPGTRFEVLAVDIDAKTGTRVIFVDEVLQGGKQ